MIPIIPFILLSSLVYGYYDQSVSFEEEMLIGDIIDLEVLANKVGAEKILNKFSLGSSLLNSVTKITFSAWLCYALGVLIAIFFK